MQQTQYKLDNEVRIIIVVVKIYRKEKKTVFIF